MTLQELATWLDPGRSPIAVVIRGGKEEKKGFIRNETDSLNVWRAWQEQRLQDINCESISQEGHSYKISDVTRVGIILCKNEMVCRVGFDLDDHDKTKGIEAVSNAADEIDNWLGAVGVRFTSRSGTGLHLFYELQKPIIVDMWLEWVRRCGFNKTGEPEAFPKTDKKICMWLPNLPNANGGDTWKLGDHLSAMIKELPELPEEDRDVEAAKKTTVLISTTVSAQTTAYGRSVLEREKKALAEAVAPGRHDQLIRTVKALSSLVAGGKELTEADARAAIAEATALNGQAAEPASYGMEKAIRDAWAYGQAKPRIAPENPVSKARSGCPFALTDLGNAERLAFYSQGKLLYDSAEKLWRRWDGRRWSADENSPIQWAMKVARKIREEAAVAPAPASKGAGDLRDLLWKHAISSESKTKLEAMVHLASRLEGVSIPRELWDTNIFLINCKNGTIDLRTGVLRPADPEDLISRLAPVDYDPTLKDKRFDDLINWAAEGDSQVAEYIQKAAGCTLTGDVSEDALFVAYGPTRGGKSTFLGGLRAALGDYSVTVDPEQLAKSRDPRQGASEHVAKLSGMRAAIGSEMEKGRELSTALLKALSGETKMTARHIYCRSFEFTPTHHIWLGFNHAPKIDADDDAIWQRVRCVGFARTVPEAMRDPTLRPWMADPNGGAAVLFTWAVEGCKKWLKDRKTGPGLMMPTAIARACSAYREECDPCAEFFKERCVFSPSVSIKRSTLFHEYQKWADENGLKDRYRCSPRTIARGLRNRGIGGNDEKKGSNGDRLWLGICLLPAYLPANLASKND